MGVAKKMVIHSNSSTQISGIVVNHARVGEPAYFIVLLFWNLCSSSYFKKTFRNDIILNALRWRKESDRMFPVFLSYDSLKLISG